MENVSKLIQARINLTKTLMAVNPDPDGIDRYMSELVHYVGLVSDDLAQLEANYEENKIRTFNQEKSKSSVNQADQLARHTEGKGDIAKLTRLVNTSWSTITASQVKLKKIQGELNVARTTTNA